MTTAPLPLQYGMRGDAVRDLQQRLARLGFARTDPIGLFGEGTRAAVEQYQAHAGLDIDGICALVTWSCLVEAGYRLGDRLLYHRSPMMRGEDVADLQGRFSALGFDSGRVDGIFGPLTATALAEFQRNSGLPTDAICGPETIAALDRLGVRTSALAVAHIREDERLSSAPRQMRGMSLALADPGGLNQLIAATAHRLRGAGATVSVLDHPDGAQQAREANDLRAGAFLCIRLQATGGVAAYFFKTPTFESRGGRRLAELVVRHIGDLDPTAPTVAAGRRLPVLRETRMPAVLVEIGPPTFLVRHTSQIARAIAEAFEHWVTQPTTGEL